WRVLNRCPISRLSIGPSSRDTWPLACGKVVTMRCTECRTESTTGSKYCVACGSPLSSRCPKCGAENAPASVFCEDCGSELAVNAAPASTRSSQTESTANNIRITPEQPGASPAIEGERKTVAPMFADIKGSMDLMEDLDPE